MEALLRLIVLYHQVLDRFKGVFTGHICQGYNGDPLNLEKLWRDKLAEHFYGALLILYIVFYIL
ncbi:hypothetical protein D3C87_1652600 [compost metagenome]